MLQAQSFSVNDATIARSDSKNNTENSIALESAQVNGSFARAVAANRHQNPSVAASASCHDTVPAFVPTLSAASAKILRYQLPLTTCLAARAVST